MRKTGIICCAVLMAALFESLFNPFIIMFSLPMALIGAILALGTHVVFGVDGAWYEVVPEA